MPSAAEPRWHRRAFLAPAETCRIPRSPSDGCDRRASDDRDCGRHIRARWPRHAHDASNTPAAGAWQRRKQSIGRSTSASLLLSSRFGFATISIFAPLHKSLKFYEFQALRSPIHAAPAVNKGVYRSPVASAAPGNAGTTPSDYWLKPVAELRQDIVVGWV